MYRGLLVCPAGVEVSIVFDGSVPDELVDAVRLSWASLNPRDIEPGEEFAGPHLILVTDRSQAEVVAEAEEQGRAVPFVVHLRSAAHAQERLTVEVTLRMLEQLAGELTLFHAAALGDSATKQAMVLIGPSGRGKTTASRFLGQHFAYLSDETAVIQPDRRIRPYPKPLSVIEVRGEPKVQHDPGQAGLKPVNPTDSSYVLSRVILLDRRNEPVAPRLERVELADALLEIVQQTSGLVKTEDGVRQLIELIEACGGAQRLVYHEIHETLEILQRELAEVAEPVQYQVEYFQPVEEEPLNGGLLHRLPDSSGYLMDDRLLLLHNPQLFELSLFAADCWLAAEKPLSEAGLKSQLEELYGEIPAEDFSGVIDQLVQTQILRRGAA